MSSVRFALALLLFLSTTSVHGAWGVLDRVAGSSVLLPFFEVGIDSTLLPHDTSPVIYNRSPDDVIVHWEVYDIDGNAIFWDSRTIASGATWAFSMRSLIAANPLAPDLANLVQGDFYRGFMTIDVVTAPTILSPFNPNYPFALNDAIIGYAYYTRLAQGSANGLTLPTLEGTPPNAPIGSLGGFYGSNDSREAIDIPARTCAQALTQGALCFSPIGGFATIRTRIFQSNAINGSTRLVIFTWDTSRPSQGGPSAICNQLGTCSEDYVFNRRKENGTLADIGVIRLDHVVNVIEITEGDVAPGEHIISRVQDPGTSLQLFGFSFNSASPAGNPNINWDAIFEAHVTPVVPLLLQ